VNQKIVELEMKARAIEITTMYNYEG